MTSSERKDYVRGISPLYVKGLLPDSEREEFEQLLAEAPELREEVDRWRNLAGVYKRIECELPLPSNTAYARISERIRKTDDRSFFERYMPSPSFSFGVIVAEFLIIVALSVIALSVGHEYRTLSAPSAIVERPVRINVVFRQGVSEVEVRNLLLQINGRVVDGPFMSGLYIVGIASDNEFEKSLKVLKDSGLTTMAERAY